MNKSLITFLGCIFMHSPVFAEAEAEAVSVRAFMEWQELHQRSAADAKTKEAQIKRTQEEKKMADRLMACHDAKGAAHFRFYGVLALMEQGPLKNEVVVRFMRRPWLHESTLHDDPAKEIRKLRDGFSVDSAVHCAVAMQPYLPKEKLYPYSDEANPARFRYHRWRFDMAEKFRAALAEKGQIVGPPDQIDIPEDSSTGEEIWSQSDYNPKRGAIGKPPYAPHMSPPTQVGASEAAKQVSIPNYWIWSLAAASLSAVGLLVWFRSRR